VDAGHARPNAALLVGGDAGASEVIEQTDVSRADRRAPQQRCVVHLQRNVVGKVPQRLRARLAREVWRIFEAPSKAEARKRMEQLQAGLGKQVPEAMACLANGFEAATQFYAFPKEHWHSIRSTNGLERLHGEIKRRTNAVGAFPDRASALRLVTAVALNVTAIWTDPLSRHVTAEAEGGRRRQRGVKQTRSFTVSPFYTQTGT